MKLRFQADKNLNQRIVAATRRLSAEIDLRTAVAAGLHAGRSNPPDVLATADDEGRVLVTHDRRTMPGHFAESLPTRHSPVVVIVSQRLAISRAAERLYLMWAATEAEEYLNLLYDFP